MANGTLVIDKPADWTASEHALLERASAEAKALILAGASFSRRTREAGLRREEGGRYHA